MRGQILQADSAAGSGLILGSDGNRYSFARSDWKGPSAPVAGAEVDFIAGEGIAHDIFPLPGNSGAAAASSTSAPAARDEGSSQLIGILGVLCLVLGFVIPVIPTVAALILGLIGAESAKRHNNESGLILSRIAWIGALILLLIGVVLITVAVTFALPLFDIIWQYVIQVIREESAQTALLVL